MGSVPLDKNYKGAQKLPKESIAWRENQAMHAWLNTKWLPLPRVNVINNACPKYFTIILLYNDDNNALGFITYPLYSAPIFLLAYQK